MHVLSVTDGGISPEGVRRLLAGVEAEVEVLGYADFNGMPAESRARYDPDLILLEDRPAICDVFECLATLFSRLPGVPVIVLLRDDGTDKLRRAVREGARGVASIGVSHQMFGAIAKIVLAGGVYVPETLVRALLGGDAAPSPTVPAEPDATAPLTQRQIEVLDLLTGCLSNKEIAAILNIGASTVKQHLHAIFRVLGVDNRTQAASRVLKERGK